MANAEEIARDLLVAAIRTSDWAAQRKLWLGTERIAALPGPEAIEELRSLLALAITQRWISEEPARATFDRAEFAALNEEDPTPATQVIRGLWEKLLIVFAEDDRDRDGPLGRSPSDRRDDRWDR